MDGTKTTTNWIIAGLVALVVIIGGGWLIARERAGVMADAPSAKETTSKDSKDAKGNTVSSTPAAGSQAASAAASTDMMASAAGETVTVMDQPAGEKVTVSDVNIKKPTWVAVRDTRKWYPGAVLLTESKSDVEIPLLRSTVAGDTYEVVLFVDDGDATFSIHGGDMLIVGTEGAPVSSTFKAQ